MATTKHENSVHVRLNDEADAVAELLCEAQEVAKSELISKLVHRALLGEGHAVKIAALRYSRLGLAGSNRE